MRKLVSACIVFSLLSLAYFQVIAEEDTATIRTHVYGLHGIREKKVEVSIEEAMKIAEALKELKDAIKADDETTALHIASRLKKENVFSDTILDFIQNQLRDTSFSQLKQGNSTMNLTNLLCVVLGFGEGIFVYPLDLLAIYFIIVRFGLMPFGFLLVLLLSMFWLSLSHLLPVRFVLPLTLFGIGEGELLTAGLKGIASVKPEHNETAIGILVGFIGVVINIYLFPKEDREEIAQFFCIGYSLAALKRTDTNSTFLNLNSPVPIVLDLCTQFSRSSS
jgi:hypothetical protein